MSYLLDANVFIQSARMEYGFNFCPAFWDFLDLKNKSKEVFTIQQVFDEVVDINKEKPDALSQWLKLRKNYILPNSSWTESCAIEVTKKVNEYGKSSEQIKQFLEVADYHLVVQALAGSHTFKAHNFDTFYS